MIDLQQFKKNALARGLCENYTSMWSDEKGKRQLFELACDANSVEYMAKSLSEGWGLSPDFISDKFKAYINGKYICEYKNNKGHGYTSTMLCNFEEETFEVNTTLLCVLSSKTQLYIKPNHLCKIYIAGESYIDLKLGENSMCYLYVYGGEPMITGDVTDKKVVVKRIMEEKQ